uniref:Holin n=1 Tax=viral metagenome TaxID=1070528 RepID=A0A6M3L9R7_9ZZZZ
MEGDFLKSLVGLGSVPVIMGLVEYTKRWIENEKWYPAIAIVLGLAINLVIPWAFDVTGKVEWTSAVVMGVMAGLAASGLFSSVETARGN